MSDWLKATGPVAGGVAVEPLRPYFLAATVLAAVLATFPSWQDLVL